MVNKNLFEKMKEELKRNGFKLRKATRIELENNEGIEYYIGYWGENSKTDVVLIAVTNKGILFENPYDVEIKINSLNEFKSVLRDYMARY